MSNLRLQTPSQGSRVVQGENSGILFEQPPEVLKGLILNNIANIKVFKKGEAVDIDDSAWAILAEGRMQDDQDEYGIGSEYGWRPFIETKTATFTCLEDCKIVSFRKDLLEHCRLNFPQLNYQLRKLRIEQYDKESVIDQDSSARRPDWLLGEVEIY
ncbi:MAG: hypothetical protein VB957_04900 [Pseudomonadales bacterium]